MNTSNRSRLLSLALLAGFGLCSASNALAAAGDTISNSATLKYSVSGSNQTDITSAATTFKEDRKINFTVARDTTQNVGPGGTAQAVVFTVTNNGNATQNILLRAEHLSGVADPFGGGSSDIFTPTGLIARVDADNAAGTYDPANDTAVFISDLAPGASQRVYVIADMPTLRTDTLALTNNDLSVVSLVAQAALPATPVVGSGEVAGTGIAADAITNDDNNNVSPGGSFQVTGGSTTVIAGINSDIPDTTANMETVFADPAGAGGTASGARTGEHADASSYTMLVSSLTVTKVSAALWDDINLNSNPKSIPGGIVRYTITIDNAAAAGPADLTTIEDVLPLVLDSKFGDGTAGNAAVSGANNVRITDGLGATVFCLADNTDGNGDGCRDDGGVGGNALSVDLTAVAGISNVLSASETMTIEFDVVIP